MAPQPPWPPSRDIRPQERHPSPRPIQTHSAVSKHAAAASPRRARPHAATAVATTHEHHYTAVNRTQSPPWNDRIEQQPHITSFWGPDPVPLPSRFARIKRGLIAGQEDALEASWTRLLAALRQDVEHIDGLGAHLIPSIEFNDLDDGAQSTRFQRDLKRYGVGVVRKVVPRRDAESAIRDTVSYVDGQQKGDTRDGTELTGGGGGGGFTAGIKAAASEAMDPACYNFFWSPAQVRMRAHPNVRKAQKFMMSLWDTAPDGQVSTEHPITYADRIRVYGPHDSLGQHHHHRNDDGNNRHQQHDERATRPRHSTNVSQPQSPEDWLTALQSSAGIIAQVDNGSLERWEPDGYQRAGTYSPIFRGQWEDHDPWISALRSPATTDLYNGHGACTVFRMFQGVLALSTVEPGMIRLLPSPKVTTAYYLLRPFFAPVHALPTGMEKMPPHRQDEEWQMYLAPENWRLMREPDTVIHGAVPGHAQRVTERWHPHLHLRSSMITLPTLQPGDYILWHPDLPYHISSGESSLAGSVPQPPPPATATAMLQGLRMLLYIPAVPLTQSSALYLARQRKAFQRGQPGPDFDSSGHNHPVEGQDTAAAEAEIERIGDKDGLRAMGLAPWDVSALLTRPSTPCPVALPGSSDLSRSHQQHRLISETEQGGGARMENEVVRLANIILFPEISLLG